MNEPEERPALALLFSLGASAFFACMGVCVKALGGAVGTPETVFFRGVVGGLVGLAAHAVLRRPLRMGSSRVLALRILCGTFSLLCYYGAISGVSGDKGALATANLLLKTAPVWVALGAGFVLGERAGTRTWLALAVGVAGAAIALLGPTEAGGGRSTVALGLASGVFAAGAYLAVRRLATSEEPLAVVTLFSIGVAVATAPFVVARWQPLPQGRSLLLLLGVALSGTFAQLLMTHAYRHTRAAIVAVTGLAEVAFTVGAAIAVFHEEPSAWSFAGGGLAVLAGLVATWPRRSVTG